MRSVSRAAEVLGVSKSVVSERVSQLERLVGQPLLFRSTRRIRLTEAGEEAYPLYADLVARLRDLQPSGGAEPAQLSGRLRVASIIDVGVTDMSAQISAFVREYPQLEVELVVGEGLVNPVDDGFDITLHYRRMRSDRIHQQAVARVPTAVYASPAYLEVHGMPRVPADLEHHRCIGYSQQVTVNNWNASRWEFAARGATHAVKVMLGARSNSGLVLRRWAIDGHGVAILPRLRAEDAARESALVELLPGYEAPSLWLYASYARTQRHTLKVTRFIARLRAGFAAVTGAPLDE